MPSSQQNDVYIVNVFSCAEGIILAQKDNIDWILHIDTDELMYPGGTSHYSLQRLLADVPEEVDTLVFPNYESLPERDDIVSPFEEVSDNTYAPKWGREFCDDQHWTVSLPWMPLL